MQELFCIETLARVDTLCLDKTGTITEGRMEVNDIITKNIELNEMQEILSAIGKNSEDSNSTIEAIRDKYENIKLEGEWEKTKTVPFSSKKKWSGIEFKQKGSYIIGAPEFVLKDTIENHKMILKNIQLTIECLY